MRLIDPDGACHLGLDSPVIGCQAARMFAALAPMLFVLIWSTGFVAARGEMPHADPQLFLAVRMTATAMLLAIVAIGRRESWPRGRRLVLHLTVGGLLPGFYLCASWWSVQRGMPAGIMALLGALQPLPIALLSFALLGEVLSARTAGGIAVGVVGVALVLLPVIERGNGAFSALPMTIGLAAVVAMAAATLIQHARLAAEPLFAGLAVQNIGGAAVGALAWLLVGTARWDGSAGLWGAMIWSVVGLSIGGLVLLSWLVRRQGATRVSVLLILVPPLAAIEAWALFGERLGLLQLLGFALALGGVLVARAGPRRTVREAIMARGRRQGLAPD